MKSKILLLVILTAVIGLLASCSGEKKGRGGGRTETRSDVQEAAIKTYVAPGDMDKYYIFKSGGHSGQVYIYGVPSMRHIATIPVFTPYPATGYGFDKDTKEMLGGFTWGTSWGSGWGPTSTASWCGPWATVAVPPAKPADPRGINHYLYPIIVHPQDLEW